MTPVRRILSASRVARGALLLLACLIALPELARAAAPRFASRYYLFDTVKTPSFKAADLDGDGRLDLVATVSGYFESRVTILHGDGERLLRAGAAYTVDGGVKSLGLADLTADGRPDLLVLKSHFSGVQIHNGLGDGTFAPPWAIPAGFLPYSTAAGELVGSAPLDVALTDGMGDRVCVCRNDGLSFALPFCYATGSFPTAGPAIGDLDRRFGRDLAVGCYGAAAVAVHLADGLGGFPLAGLHAVAGAPFGLVTADLDRDGDLDLVTANGTGSAAISVLLGTGDGGFLPRTDYGGPDPGFEVAVADVDRDGHLDLISAARVLSVFRGRGDGTFQAALDTPTPAASYGILIGDLDGDGRLDAAIGPGGFDHACVLLGRGDGTFEREPTFAPGIAPAALLLADMDRDGRLDLVAVDPALAAVSVFRNLGGGAFGPRLDSPCAPGPLALAVADLNGDGAADAVTGNSSSSLAILLGRGDGGFLPPTTLALGWIPFAVAVADVDRDGDPDLIACDTNHHQLAVFRGDGSGGFASGPVLPTPYRPWWVLARDFDADGRTDLACANFSDSSVSVFLGTGGGAFGPRRDFRVGAGPRRVDAADFDGDGDLDLATVDVTEQRLSLLPGNGNGTFGARLVLATAPEPVAAVLGDLTADGRADIAAVNRQDQSVSVLEGTGAGAFLPKVDLGTGSDPRLLAMGDVDGDARPDLVVANLGEGTISLLLNRSDLPVPALPTVLTATAEPGCAVLRWSRPVGADGAAYVYRREAISDWMRIGEAAVEATGSLAYEDREVAAGDRYGYRLGLAGPTQEIFAGEVWLDIPGARTLALAGFFPNPARGAPLVSFTLPTAGPARLEVFDVSGRRVHDESVGGCGPGSHLRPVTGGAAAPPGVYAIRLTQGGRTLTAKGIVLP